MWPAKIQIHETEQGDVFDVRRGELAPAFGPAIRSGESLSHEFLMPLDATSVVVRMPHATLDSTVFMPTAASKVWKTIEISVNGGAWRALMGSDTEGGLQPRPTSRGGGFEPMTHMYRNNIPLAAERRIRVRINVVGTPANCQFDVGFL